MFRLWSFLELRHHIKNTSMKGISLEMTDWHYFFFCIYFHRGLNETTTKLLLIKDAWIFVCELFKHHNASCRDAIVWRLVQLSRGNADVKLQHNRGCSANCVPGDISIIMSIMYRMQNSTKNKKWGKIIIEVAKS